jgi:hypothetical protein
MMKRAGKSPESHIYPKVTHLVVYFQDRSRNGEQSPKLVFPHSSNQRRLRPRELRRVCARWKR